MKYNLLYNHFYLFLGITRTRQLLKNSLCCLVIADIYPNESLHPSPCVNPLLSSTEWTNNFLPLLT